VLVSGEPSFVSLAMAHGSIKALIGLWFTPQSLTALLPLILVLWLLPCALQDYRRRRVANGLTVPAFFPA
jgi:hypothetical protein